MYVHTDPLFGTWLMQLGYNTTHNIYIYQAHRLVLGTAVALAPFFSPGVSTRVMFLRIGASTTDPSNFVKKLLPNCHVSGCHPKERDTGQDTAMKRIRDRDVGEAVQ